jgi:hypothetical protein
LPRLCDLGGVVGEIGAYWGNHREACFFAPLNVTEVAEVLGSRSVAVEHRTGEDVVGVLEDLDRAQRKLAAEEQHEAEHLQIHLWKSS